MNQIPLFNQNILPHIYNNFVHYFKYFNAYQYFIATILVLLACWLITKYLFIGKYYLPIVPKRDDESSAQDKNGWYCAWAAMIFSFAFYVFRFAIEEQTILNNFDSMNPGFMRNLTYGVLPVFKDWRFTPLSHVDGNLIFGITANYWMIGWYCVLKQILVLYLMYKCFDFVSKTKRLYLVALINFIPAVFSINNFVFPEQNIAIFVFLSLIGLNKYQKTQKARWLLLFLIFMNCAIYSKETVMLFYGGYGLYLFIEAIVMNFYNGYCYPPVSISKSSAKWMLILGILFSIAGIACGSIIGVYEVFAPFLGGGTQRLCVAIIFCSIFGIILLYCAYCLFRLSNKDLVFDGVSCRISWNLMKNPWKQLMVLPVEFLMFISAFIWVTFYYAVTPYLSDNRYLMTHYFDMMVLLKVYALELVIVLIALVLFVRKLYEKKFSDMNLMMEGSLLASLLMVVYVVFIIKIAPSQDYPESYYLYLPAVFCTFYVFDNLRQKSAAQILAALVVLVSLYENYDFFINMQGAARHELVEFIANKAPKKQGVDNSNYPQGSSYMQLDAFLKDRQNKPMTIHFFSRQKIDTVFWKTTGWKVSLGFLLPDRNIVLKMDEFYKQFLIGGYSGLEFSYEAAVPGDYIIINKIFDANLPRLKTLVFENDVYAVYVVE